jgi:hypothetical protein
MLELFGFGDPWAVAAWALACAVVLLWYIAELVRRRPITVPSFVVLWAFFLPILMQYPFTFSPVNALAVGADGFQSYPRFIDEVLLVSLLGMAAFLAGFTWTRGRGSFYPAELVTRSLRILNQSSWLVVTSVTIAGLFLLLFVAGLVGAGGARQAAQAAPVLRPIYNAVHTLLPITIALNLLAGIQERRLGMLMLGLLNLGLGILTGARSVVFGGVLFYLLAVITYRSLTRGMSAWRTLRLVPLAAALLVLAVYIGDIREGQFNILVTIATLGAKLLYGNNFSDLRDFAWVRSYWDGGFFYGKTQLAGLLSFVPSFLLDFRADWNWGVVTTTMVGLNSEVTPGLRTGPFGEAFFNFGLVGVLAAGLLYGAVCRGVHQYTVNVARERSPRDARLAILAAFISLSLVGSFLNTAGFYGFYLTIVLLLAVWVFHRIFQEMQVSHQGRRPLLPAGPARE